MEYSPKLPRELLFAIGRAHATISRLPDACVPSSVAFTHNADQETWLSGLTFSARVNGVKKGANHLAKRYGEKEEIVAINTDDSAASVSFLMTHTKNWILTFGVKPEDGHMFAAIKDNRDPEKQNFFVWDTLSVTAGEDRAFQSSVNEIIERIKNHNVGSPYYYLIGFNPK